MLEDTIVIYCSDHGEMLGNHGLRSKGVMYRDSVGVPLIVSYPRAFLRDREIDAPVSLLDLVPTVLEEAGLGVPPGVEGRSLLPLLTGEATRHEAAVFSEIANGDGLHVQMVQTDRHKYVTAERWDTGATPFRALLFDLQNDPLELENLAGSTDAAATERALREMLAMWRARPITPPPVLDGSGPAPPSPR
jgi:arylsulfatase A-like enzyme